MSSTLSHTHSETSQLDGLTFQIYAKEKKLHDLLTEYSSLVSASQFDMKDSESADLMIQLSHRESLIYQEETQNEVYKYVLERTKRSNDSMKAKVKHLQRIRNRTLILYKEANESSTEAIKINNLESAKIQHIEAFISESRDLISKKLTGKLEEIKQLAEEKSAKNPKQIEDAESALIKMRTQEFRKRIIYFNRQKESTSIMRASLIAQRQNYRFKLNKVFRNLGSTNIEECLDKYFEVISKHTSMSMRTDELLEQLNSLLTQEKKLRSVLVAHENYVFIPTDADCTKTNEKIDIIFKPQYDKFRKLQAGIYNKEVLLKKQTDIILKICMIISVLVQRVENQDEFDTLGPENSFKLPTHIKATKDEHLSGILDSIHTLTPNAIMILLLLEKKLVSVVNYLNVYCRTHIGNTAAIIFNSAGQLCIGRKLRNLQKRSTILDAFTLDLSAKNVEVIKKNIYNTHFIDTEKSNYTNVIYDMITGAAQLTEDYRKTFEKQPKKIDTGKVDFLYEGIDDETLIRNKELAILCENTQRMSSLKPESRKADKETIIEKRKKKAMDLGNLFHSRSQNEIPVLPYIHRSVRNLAAKTNRLRIVSNSESLSSICQDISKMKTDLYKISLKSPIKESLTKFPKIRAVSRSEMSSPVSMGMKTNGSSKIFIKKGNS